MQKIIESAWDNLANLTITDELRNAVEQTLQQLDAKI